MLILTFSAQQITCAIDARGKVIEGGKVRRSKSHVLMAFKLTEISFVPHVSKMLCKSLFDICGTQVVQRSIFM